MTNDYWLLTNVTANKTAALQSINLCETKGLFTGIRFNVALTDPFTGDFNRTQSGSYLGTPDNCLLYNIDYYNSESIN
jgi:hypothetical protein